MGHTGEMQKTIKKKKCVPREIYILERKAQSFVYFRMKNILDATRVSWINRLGVHLRALLNHTGFFYLSVGLVFVLPPEFHFWLLKGKHHGDLTLLTVQALKTILVSYFINSTRHIRNTQLLNL